MEQKRNTKQRQLILDILTNSSRPMSINDIYQKIIHEIPTIAKSTIYRNIDSLLNQNLIDKYYLNDNELFYQIKDNTNHHKHYVICDSCKKMFDLPLCPIHEIEDVMKKEGFSISDHYIQISGTCKDCLKKKNE
ncbi:Fur family transcriptional regulator [Anaerocolumna aminovalerica]|jgi:Fur family ferric uptake transcriptional regulator|uniref:Fur family transcriptional regulator, zinc uptake regulator n=1 Tax=Anaerocolumna aminovalerica TaxID=1527 RepID=A0A1I5GH30_9FIRM|nr:transcriptional repressor [Anaerocolumna aminovalerica]MDU6264581.1 transcriptional repressor [Anaerocolumna aminovalerica]SFO35186.1 Fur family transcriptional regulator, zinc uptake regulator [Anaerocolumna aminovalerica]